MKTTVFRLMCLLMPLVVSACGQPDEDSAAHSSQVAALDQTKRSEPTLEETKLLEQYPLLDWGELSPTNWDEMALLKDFDLSSMEDDDPRAFELLKEVREQWNNAPVIKSLDGKAVTMHGYVVPLDDNIAHAKSFLLVPYFGACIHSPPPPSNQVIYVHVAGDGIPLSNWDAFVSVTGSLIVKQTDSTLGTAGYQMQADIVKPISDSIE